ncbi:MAG: hypothetical protein ACRDRL_01475, partial [Sciscionella sp.]
MRELLHQIAAWRAAGRPVTIARAVAVRGMSSADGYPFAALTGDAPPVGSVLSGAVDEQLADLVRTPVGAGRIVDVRVEDERALASGLSCGGSARLLMQSADAIPGTAWQLIADREPVCLLTELDGDVASATSAVTKDSVAAAERDHPGLARLFARGASVSTLLDDERTAVTAIWPVPALVVVGNGLIADALAAQAELLGWSCTIVDEALAAVAAIEPLALCDG